MKKTLLALAVAALSANAFATDIDYTAAAPGVNTVATELSLPAQNLLTTDDNLTWDLGFSLTTATKRYVKITLTGGATFTTAPDLQVAGADNGVVVQGGTGANFVIFEVTPAANRAQTDDVVLNLNDLTLAGKTNVGVSYQLFETAVDAVNGTNALASRAAAPYLNFASGLATRVEGFDTQRVIDVAADPASTAFSGAVDANTAKIGAVAIDVVPNLVTYTTANALTLTDLVAAGTQLVVNGDFSAGLKDGNGELQVGTVTLDSDADAATAAVAANSITATSATFVLNAAALGDTAAPVYADIFYTVNGNDVIVPSSYSATYDVTAAGNTTTADVNLGKVGELAKTGSSVDVELALTPAEGAFQNFVRITNLTSLAGNVYLTVFNDAGRSVSFPLSAVSGQNAGLEANGSTSLIDIKAIYAAAQAADATFALANGRDKLRLVIDGEFGDNNRGIEAQAISLSKDGQSFSTF